VKLEVHNYIIDSHISLLSEDTSIYHIDLKNLVICDNQILKACSLFL